MSSFLYRRPFGFQKRLPTNWRTKLAQKLVSFWHPFGGQKSCMTFCRPFFEFWTPKSHQKDSKKSRRFFCPPIWSATKKRQQKVGEVILVGKRSSWWRGQQKVVAPALIFRWHKFCWVGTLCTVLNPNHIQAAQGFRTALALWMKLVFKEGRQKGYVH